jgi:hypothetical protein
VGLTVLGAVAGLAAAGVTFGVAAALGVAAGFGVAAALGVAAGLAVAAPGLTLEGVGLALADAGVALDAAGLPLAGAGEALDGAADPPMVVGAPGARYSGTGGFGANAGPETGSRYDGVVEAARFSFAPLAVETPPASTAKDASVRNR